MLLELQIILVIFRAKVRTGVHAGLFVYIIKLLSVLLFIVGKTMKRKMTRSARKTNWRMFVANKPLFWTCVIVVIALVFCHPSVKSWFRVVSSHAYNWTIIQMTN